MYDSPGIEAVFSGVTQGDLCCFGGYREFSFIVISVMGRRVVQAPIQTAVSTITSLELCTFGRETAEARTILVVAGKYCDYSNGRTDIFDITGLANKFSIASGSFSRTISQLSKRSVQRA